MRVRIMLVAVLLVAGCSSSGGGSGSPFGLGSGGGNGGTGSGGTTGTAGQAASYGYGARASGVDYQPDVVVVGGGPGAIRSVSDDGLTWTISRSASGASRLQVGKVMFLTSVAAGRVAAIHDEGDTRVVTIAPVRLTDVLRNGSINLDTPIDSSKVTFQEVPGLAVADTTPASSSAPSGSSAQPSGTHSFLQAPAALAAAVSGALPPPVKGTGEIAIGKFKVKPAFSSDGKLGATVEYTGSGGLKLTFTVTFTTSHLSVTGRESVSNGQTGAPTVKINGITGVQVSVEAGSATGSAGNGKATLTIPGEFKIPFPPSPATAGLPLTLSLKYKMYVSTALVGKNATLVASGKYKLDGPIGVDAGHLLTPTLSVEQSIVDSISGISIGPSGLVVAFNFKTKLGIGPPLLNGGPEAGLTISVGVTNGSAIGITRCHGATLDLVGSFGANISVDLGLAPVLKLLLPKGTKLEIGSEITQTLFTRTVTVPNVPVCKA